MIRRHFALLFAFVFLTLSSGRSFAGGLRDLNWQAWGHQFSMKDQVVRAAWSDSQVWKGTFCNGGYRTSFDANGRIADVDVVVNEDGTLSVSGYIENIRVGVGMSYRSDFSFCNVVRGGYLARADRAHLKGLVTFVERGTELPPTVAVKVLSTQISRVRLLGDMPDWFDDAVTSAFNYGFSTLWSSSWGDWLNQKISEEVQKYFPKKDDKMLTRA